MGLLKFLQSLFQSKKKNLQEKNSSIHDVSFAPGAGDGEPGIYSEAASLLTSWTKRPVTKLIIDELDSSASTLIGIKSNAKADEGRKIVLDHQQELIAEGLFLFIYSLDSNEYELAITGITTDPYELMRLLQTNGVNHDVDTEMIIDKWKRWDERFGIQPIAIGMDFCECAILNRNIDVLGLAKEIYEFCPDVVDQGTETVEALAEAIRSSGTIFLWWD